MWLRNVWGIECMADSIGDISERLGEGLSSLYS